jgi:hypothetical protein
MFHNSLHKINDDPTMTWEQACRQVKNDINLYQSNEYLSGRKRSAEEDIMNSAMIQSTSSLALPPVDRRNPYLMLPQQTYSTSSSSSIPRQVFSMRKSSAGCWNCSGDDHYARECPKLVCNRCGASFKDRHVPSYHTWQNCPFLSQQPSSPSASISQPFVRQVRGRSRGRGQNGRGGRGRGRFAAADRQINAATTTSSTSVVEALAREYDEEVDPWDEYGVPNATQHEHEDYYFNGMTMMSHGLDLLNEKFCQVLQDSGANINACNRKLPEFLKLKICKWRVPLRVTFGNGSSSWSTEYVNLGSILGNTAIIEDCSYNS